MKHRFPAIVQTHPMKKRTLLGLAATLPLLLVAGCGGGDSGNDAQVRLLNASTGYASVDLYVDDDLEISGTAYGSLSGFSGVPNGDVTTVLTSNGSSTELLSQSRNLSAGENYTIIAYGWEGALKSVILQEDEEEADSGKTKVAVLNTAADAGELDIYLTGPDELLASATPVAAGVAGGTLSTYTPITSGTFRLRVTAADDPEDVRLDVSDVVLKAKDVVTLVLTPGRSGVLVNSLMLVQGGTVTQQANTQARARVVAAVRSSGTVSLTAGGTSLASGAKSPTIRDYVLIDAGDLAVDSTVNGTALATQTLSVAPGSDVTLLVTGSSAADAQVVLVNDDNRLPTTTTKYKLRLVHATPSLASDNLTLTVDFSAVASDLPFATASDFSSLTASSSASLEVTSPSSAVPLYSATDLNLAALGVYTVFLFDTTAGPNGVLRKDR